MKKFKIPFIILAVCTVLALWSSCGENGAWKSSRSVVGQGLSGPFQANAVDRITFTDFGGTVELRRNERGNWSTPDRQDFPVASEKTANFLYRLEQLRAAQTIPGYESSEDARYGLKEPASGAEGSGIRIQVESKGQRVADILCGKKIQHERFIGNRLLADPPSGRYFKTAELGTVACAESFNALDGGVAYWLKRTFMNIEYVLSVECQELSPTPKSLYAASRANLGSTFFFNDRLPGAPADHSRVLNHVLLWNAPNFLDVVPIESIDMQKLAFRIRLTTADGFIYDIYLGHKEMVNAPPCPFFFYKLSRTAREKTAPDRSFDAKGNSIAFPREEIQLSAKFNREKQFERWAYLIPDETYAIVTAPRVYLQTKARPQNRETTELIRPR